MTKLVVRSRVGPDGLLNLSLPLGAAEADTEVEVTIEPAKKRPKTQKEWEEFVLRSAGSIDDPTFVRHPQGIMEQRDPLE